MSVTPMTVPPPANGGFRWDPAGRRPNLVAVIILMAVTLFIALWCQSRASDDGVGNANVSNIPYERGDWKCFDETADTDLMAQIGADSYALRDYVNLRTHQQVQLYVVYRRYGRREFNHNPDQCFPAGGYTVTKRDTTMLPWAGEEIPAVYMLFDGSRVERKDGKEGVPPATVTYFFASGSRTEHVFLKQQLWMSLERFNRNKNGWTLIRLNSPRITTDDDALAAQRDFLKAFGDPIHAAITTDSVDDVKEGS